MELKEHEAFFFSSFVAHNSNKNEKLWNLYFEVKIPSDGGDSVGEIKQRLK